MAVYVSQGINILIPDYESSFPKGERASFASLKCIFPNGMPMMVIISISPAMKYSKAMCRPPNMTQMMFPNVFIDLFR